MQGDEADHEAATQPYRPAESTAMQGARASRAPRRQEECQDDVEYGLSTQDERQTEKWEEEQVRGEYERQLAEEAAEANYLEECQEDLNDTAAMEAYDLAQHSAREDPVDTISDGSDA